MKKTTPPHKLRSPLGVRFVTALAAAILTLSVALSVPVSNQSARIQPTTNFDAGSDGLKTSDWSSIRDQCELRAYTAFPASDGHQARNPGQQWQTYFDNRGFTTEPDEAGWQWGLEIRSYGFPGWERAVAGRPCVNLAGQRLTYDWDGTLQEWFVNDRRGLEHGFTLRVRPAGAGDRLLVHLAVRGGLRAEVNTDGCGVRFVDAHGMTAVTYAGLTVFDADGRVLPAHFEPVVEGLKLVVSERGARYPLTIDPIAQQAYLKASNSGKNSNFGTSVSVSGDTVVVGAPWESSNATGINGSGNDNSASSSGAAYVFVRSGTTWIQQAYLKASNAGVDDFFGTSVAISGDTVVVGAPGESSGAIGVNGNGSDNTVGSSGAAYIFVRNGTNWSQQAYLKASNTGADDFFGNSVSLSGDTAVVGANQESNNTTGVNGNQSNNGSYQSGAAYVFVRSGTNWSQQAYLKASNTGPNDVFGHSVTVSGDTVVVGAIQESSNTTGVNGNQTNDSAHHSGAAYVFVRNDTNWSQQAYLKASNTGPNDSFGTSVSISGETVIVGAPGESSNAIGINADGSDNSAVGSGAAYVFVRNGTIWSQQAYLKASNTGTSDVFGISVGLSGDTAVVGAFFEGSSAIGVDGDQSNNSASRSGAVYAFVRRETNWNQQTYLKASNTGSNDFFGVSVSIACDFLVVGSPFEASNATGINGNQSDNSAPGAGAVYTFTGLGLGPRLSIVAEGSGGYLIRFTGITACTYQLQRAPSVAGPWITIVTSAVPVLGPIEYLDTNVPPSGAFYRTVQP